MARYRHIDTSPRFLTIDPQWHLLPGFFEHHMPIASADQTDLSDGELNILIAAMIDCELTVYLKKVKEAHDYFL